MKKQMTVSSPHIRGPISVTSIMMWVAGATLPGLAMLVIYYGWGYLINTVLAVLLSLAFEAAVLKLRKRPILVRLKDGSALITGLLLGIALPPLAPWWIIVVATFFAIVFVKQLYGGLGQNLFNPAMAAFALVLISFPLPMTTSWIAPDNRLEQGLPSFTQQLEYQFEVASFDAITMATPLDYYKTQIAQKTQDELLQSDEFKLGPLHGILIVNFAFLLGGILLIIKGIISWHVPVGYLAGLAGMALLFSQDPDISIPLNIHLFAGATMLGAFFIATDPTTCATSNKGKLIFGLGTGVLIYIIRTWGNFPDAVAFAILIMNFAAPFIDYYTRPTIYGSSQSIKGFQKKGADK